jgi:hypothetical protein
MDCFPAKSDIRRFKMTQQMDNNQYLLGVMTDRCRILEQTLIKVSEENKAMAAELKKLKPEKKEKKAKDEKKTDKVVPIKPKDKGDKK